MSTLTTALSVYVFSVLISPAIMGFSRYMEHEADRFGLEISHSNYAAGTSFVKLQQENLGIPRPSPIIKFLRYTHPPIGERVDFFNDYAPWETGDPQEYEHLFREPQGP